MARITKLELEQALTTQAEQLRIARLKVSTLEVDLDIQKRSVRELRAQLAATEKPQVIIKRMVPVAKPVVTRYFKSGVLFEKVRTGNTATVREVLVAPREDRDLAHEADMREHAQLSRARAQLAADFGVEPSTVALNQLVERFMK